MAVTYDVPAGKVLAVAGGCTVSIKGTLDHPMIVDNVEELVAAAPTINSLTPNSSEIGAADFDLVVAGIKFDASSVIVFANYDEPTTLNADGTLSTVVKPSLWGGPDTIEVQVRNGPAYSGPLDFTFTAPGGTRESGRNSKRK